MRNAGEGRRATELCRSQLAAAYARVLKSRQAHDVMGREGGRKGVKTLPGMVTLPRLHRAVRHGAHSYEFRLSFLTNKLLKIN